ncbi:hypothetical protein QJS66_13515 [Kocuria rhizophila]|nr:hypothetical protein QJS66_13515 [Kocuria rhizophila]
MIKMNPQDEAVAMARGHPGGRGARHEGVGAMTDNKGGDPAATETCRPRADKGAPKARACGRPSRVGEETGSVAAVPAVCTARGRGLSPPRPHPPAGCRC